MVLWDDERTTLITVMWLCGLTVDEKLKEFTFELGGPLPYELAVLLGTG